MVETPILLCELGCAIGTAKLELRKQGLPVLEADITRLTASFRSRHPRLMASFFRVAPISCVIDNAKSLWVVPALLLSRSIDLIAMSRMETPPFGEKGLMDFGVSFPPLAFSKPLTPSFASVSASPLLLIGAHL